MSYKWTDVLTTANVRHCLLYREDELAAYASAAVIETGECTNRWQIMIRSELTYQWKWHGDSVYDSMDEAKAVALALTRMES